MKWVVLLILLSQSIFAQTWIKKVNGTGLGNPLTYNPVNPNMFYAATNNNYIIVSRNRGYSWTGFGNPIPGGGSIKVIVVNPLDTLQLLAGVETGGSNPDKIMKTTDEGITWSQTWGGTFSYYGKPIEFKAVHHDTVYTMGNDTLWRSTDFGSTWDTVRIVTGFNAWCDAELRPDSASVMYLGDNASGIWKTYDYGVNWKRVYATGGEIPSIAIDPFNPRVAYASRYNGGGGILKSTDWGESWQPITTPVGSGFTWWITCSPVKEGYVYFGTYGASVPGVFMSRDSGATWSRYDTGLYPNGLLNYGLLALDTMSIIALQNDGLYKLQYPLSIHVLSPNGGEAWPNGSQHTISWTDAGLYFLRIEYTSDGGASWNIIADSIPSSQTSYNWTIPAFESNNCRIRISDPLFTSTKDTSDAPFSVYTPVVNLNSPTGGETWEVGSTYNITWFVSGPVYVDLHYSTDNGSTWTYIARRPASQGTYSWTVPNTPSTQCKVRVRSDYDPTRLDTSNLPFTITAENEFSSSLIIQNGPSDDTLVFGIHGGATDSIDAGLEETVLPPKPGAGNFDVRWHIPGTNGTKKDLRDTLSGANQQRLYTCEIQPGPSGYPFSVSWQSQVLGFGVFILRDTLTHGGLFAVDMKRDSFLTIADTTVRAFEIVHSKGLTFIVGQGGGWSLMSLPVKVVNTSTTAVFPYAASPAYFFFSGYQAKDSLIYGLGNWLKSDPVSITGIPITLDTVPVKSRWNIVGSLSYPLATSSVSTIPDSLIATSFYDYSSVGGYSPQTTLMPGKGYWVKTKGEGKLIYSTGPNAQMKTVWNNGQLKMLNTLTIEDGKHHRQTLFFGKSANNMTSEFYELPPPAPDEFDARFGNGGMVTLYDKNSENNVETALLVHALSTPIIFSWNIANEENLIYILVEKVGQTVTGELPLVKKGSYVVHEGARITFSLKASRAGEGGEVPQDFMLGQNYPNPFNPTTVIEFALPIPASVTLKVYDVLGRHVTTMLDHQPFHAGIYDREFNSSHLASGVYFYQFFAEGTDGRGAQQIFQRVRKMLVMK